MKVTARLEGERFSHIDMRVAAARRRAVERLERHLVARAERARLMRALRETRRSENAGRS